MEALDSLIFGEIRKLSTDKSYITQIQEEQTDDRPQIIQAKIDDLEAQMNRLMDLYAVGDIPVDMLQRRIQELNQTKTALESELDAIRSDDKLTQKETLRLAESFGDLIDIGDFDQIRAVIGALIDFIEIDGDDIIIHWNFT